MDNLDCCYVRAPTDCNQRIYMHIALLMMHWKGENNLLLRQQTLGEYTVVLDAGRMLSGRSG